MRFALAAAALILNALDNLTTFACLHQPAVGVYEANQLAAWSFHTVGLVPGLVFEMILTALAIAFLVYTRAFSLTIRMSVLAVMAVLSAFAVINNLQVMQQLGLL